MARYVVLYFKDNAQAETLLEDWNDALETSSQDEDGNVRVELLTPEQENNVECNIVGFVAAPTVFCDPTDGHRKKKTQSGWTRGKKYGWWVCGICKKPSLIWGHSYRAVISAARNLRDEVLAELKEEEPPKQELTPAGATPYAVAQEILQGKA